MIQIKDKADCCGCTACVSICPKDAITMEPDTLGFGSVPKSVSGKNPLKFVNFKCHCKFNVLFLIVL